jgi:uncharacterized integral membrane protein (TIGR00698 family)
MWLEKCPRKIPATDEFVAQERGVLLIRLASSRMKVSTTRMMRVGDFFGRSTEKTLAFAAPPSLAGLALCFVIALAAVEAGHIIPSLGGPVFGMLFGIVIAALLSHESRVQFAPGARLASKIILQASIVMLGLTLDMGQVLHATAGSLPVMLGTLTLCLIAGTLIGRALGLDGAVRTLITVGTGICGASAIAAVSGVIAVEQSELAYAISTIFLFNVAAVVVFPPLGHALALSQHAFGIWAGTAVNDTSSVVAAGFAYGQSAGNEAIIVKLSRTVLIVPVVAAIAAWQQFVRRHEQRKRVAWQSVFPFFIVWFALAATLNTLGVIPAAWHGAIAGTALFLIVIALSGVGLSCDLARMRRAGWRPIALGAMLWTIVALSSLALQGATGQL